MKKIIIEGVVLDMYDGDYTCSRGCYSCDKSVNTNQRSDFNIVFLKKAYKYFNEKNITYSNISFNMFGNFFYNIPFFSKAVYLFLKMNLIKPGNNILLYGKFINKKNNLTDISMFFSKFTNYFTFTLGITIDLGEKYDNLLDSLSKVQSFLIYLGNKQNIELRLVIQRPNYTNYNKEEQNIILQKLQSLEKYILIFFSEEEPSEKKAILSIKGLFYFKEYTKCLFLENNQIIMKDDILSINMLNISNERISFHNPYCMKIKSLNIGKIGDSFELINEKMNKNILNIKKIEKNYKKYGNKERICSFCIKYF